MSVIMVISLVAGGILWNDGWEEKSDWKRVVGFCILALGFYCWCEIFLI